MQQAPAGGSSLSSFDALGHVCVGVYARRACGRDNATRAMSCSAPQRSDSPEQQQQQVALTAVAGAAEQRAAEHELCGPLLVLPVSAGGGVAARGEASSKVRAKACLRGATLQVDGVAGSVPGFAGDAVL